jgi:CMP-N,N'-diacetyllegionaminic acid synthase
MNILIVICARGGSKGIPGKNIKPLNGRPLIAYTIDVAKQFASKYNADIELSTDSEEIKSVAVQCGLVTSYTRPENLAGDKVGKLDAIYHVLGYTEKRKKKKYDFVVDMDVTAPLRNLFDLEMALKQLIENKEALNIFSVSPARRNPYFNLVEMRDDGFFHTVKDGTQFLTRQSSPKVFDMNASFCFFKRKYFEEGWKTGTTSKSLAYIVPHVCFDLDEPEDFIIMGIFLKENLLDFKL